MRYLFLTLLIPFACAFGQIEQPQSGMKKCNGKLTARKGQRFTDWECGKVPGVIDCNQGLELDEGSNTVFRKAEGTEFLQDANKPFSGQCETCHPNGILERRVSFVSGKENGTDTTYYPTGCPMVVRTHIQGEENGQWTYYHDTIVSIQAWEMNFFAGEKHGKQIFFNIKGDTTLWENYNHGLLDGKKYKYYPGSKIKEEISYKKGLMDGEFLYYNTEGKMLEKLNYKEGKKNGECTYFYSDGKLLKTEFWLMDVKNGEFKTFYYQGHIQTLETYKKGIKEGAWEEYFPNQKPKRIAVYKKDVLIEEHTYDEFGNELTTFGGKTTKKTEDDALPEGDKKKKKKK
jgi:antitoxin component YwqK of YwqJK toxin-antitoxin module